MLAVDVSRIPASTARTIPLKQFTGGRRLPLIFEPAGTQVDETIWFDQATGGFRPHRVRRSATGVVLRVDTLAIPVGATGGVRFR